MSDNDGLVDELKTRLFLSWRGNDTHLEMGRRCMKLQ